MIVCGDAEVSVVKTGGKRVLRCAEHAALRIDPFQLHQGMGELLLSVKRIGPEGKFLMRPLDLLYFFNQRDDSFPDSCKEGITGRHGKPFLKTVEQDIIRLFFRIPERCHAPVRGNQFLQIGGEEGKIIVVLRLDPYI